MLRSGKGVLAVVLVLVAIVVVVVLVGLLGLGWYIRGHDRAVGLDEAVTTAWANVDSALQRRMDLIPNLVETVKGYAEHERELFESIAEARTKYFQADRPEGKIEAYNSMSGLLSRLLLLQERYPELKANQNFLALQDSLEGTENRINVERIRYNEAVKTLNTYSREVFGSFFCRMAGVERRQPFEAAPEAREAPRVDFGTTPAASPTGSGDTPANAVPGMTP
jgi:LemA protein